MADSGSHRPIILNSIDAFTRRALDIFVSFFGLLLLAPVFLLVGLLIKKDSPGPVFYHGARMGRNGKPFDILKFRTMYDSPESHAGPRVTADGDSRITSFGQWLRDTKVNELPQLWNVLVGEMSLVGPRPEDPEFTMNWPEDVRADLLSVRPGVTSPASITYRNEEKMLNRQNLLQGYLQDILPSKLRLDQLYLRNRTVLSDLDVIFLTAVTLLPQTREKGVPQHLLYWGPLARIISRVGTWLVLDLLVTLASVWVAGVFWRTLAPLNVGVLESLLASFGFALYFSLINTLLGLNNIAWNKAGPGEGALVILTGGLGTLLLAVSDRLLLGRHLFPTGMILTTGVLAIGGFLVIRYRERLITSFGSRWLAGRQSARGVGERVLIVGAGEMGNLASWLFTHGDFAAAFQIVGIVDDDPRKIGMVVDGFKILNTTDHISELIQKLDIGVVVFAINRIGQPERMRILQACQGSNVKLVLFPDLMEIMRAGMQSSEQTGAPHGEENSASRSPETSPFVSRIDELDALLAAQDVAGARALLAEIRARSQEDPTS